MSSHLKKFLLLTLSHAESGYSVHYTPHFVASKCRSLVNCESVIVVKKSHKNEGYHYHVGMVNNTANSHTATKKFCEGFSEFEGRQLYLSFHRSWATVCAYALKQDSDLFLWGITKDQINDLLNAKKRKKKGGSFIERLRKCSPWEEVLADDILATQASKNYFSVKQVFYDLKGLEKLKPLQKRLTEYLLLKEKSKKILLFSYQEMEDRGKALHWFIRNLDTFRPLRSPQLLITVEPHSGKTHFVESLKKYFLIYNVPMRKDDFSGATTLADLWFIDEFSSDRMSCLIRS